MKNILEKIKLYKKSDVLGKRSNSNFYSIYGLFDSLYNEGEKDLRSSRLNINDIIFNWSESSLNYKYLYNKKGEKNEPTN